MSKKREMTDAEWDAYRKAHPYEDIVEAERGKIARDKARCARRRSRDDALMRDRLRALAADALPPDGDSALVGADEDRDASAADEGFAAERARRNVRTRKRRLRALASRDDEEPAKSTLPGLPATPRPVRQRPER